MRGCGDVYSSSGDDLDRQPSAASSIWSSSSPNSSVRPDIASRFHPLAHRREFRPDVACFVDDDGRGFWAGRFAGDRQCNLLRSQGRHSGTPSLRVVTLPLFAREPDNPLARVLILSWRILCNCRRCTTHQAVTKTAVTILARGIMSPRSTTAWLRTLVRGDAYSR